MLQPVVKDQCPEGLGRYPPSRRRVREAEALAGVVAVFAVSLRLRNRISPQVL